MARTPGELFQMDELHPAVAVAERVDVVDVADDFTGLTGEVVAGQSFKKAALDQAPVHVTHAGLDVPAELELRAALENLDGTYLSSPFVKILKQVAVDRFQVIEIEIAGRDTLTQTLRDKAAFRPIEIGDVADIQLVAKNGVLGRITVDRIAHSAASGTGLPFARAKM